MAANIGYKGSFAIATTAFFYGAGKLAYWISSKSSNVVYSHLLAPVFRLIAANSPNALKKGGAPIGDLAGRIGHHIYSAIPDNRLMTLAKVGFAAACALYFRKAALELIGIATLTSTNTLHLSDATQYTLMRLFIRCGFLEKGCLGATDALWGGQPRDDHAKIIATNLLDYNLLGAFKAFLDHAIAIQQTPNALPTFTIKKLPKNFGAYGNADELAGLITEAINADLNWFSLTDTKVLTHVPADKPRSLVNWAAQHNCIEFLRWVESLKIHNMEYELSACIAAASGSCDTLKHLLDALVKNRRDIKKDFFTELWYNAALSNNPNIITTLLEIKDVPNEPLHSYHPTLGITPFQYAVCFSSPATIKALLKATKYTESTELVKIVPPSNKTPPILLSRDNTVEIGDSPLMLLMRRIHQKEVSHQEKGKLTDIALRWIEGLTRDALSDAQKLAINLFGANTGIAKAIENKFRYQER